MATSVERFRQVLSVAYSHLEARRQEVNDLNVFPVPDGDTGDNMALTMRHVLEELDRLEGDGDGDPERADIVQHVARAALMGARGNSGVILSQIVRGAAEELATPPGRLIDPILISAALSNATRAAYAAVREPAEGTMLTVIREMSDAVSRRLAHWEQHALSPDATDAQQNVLLAEMLAIALATAEEAVEHTPEQLDVLADAGVVDAGALGLAVIVRGLIAALVGGDVELPEIPRYEPARTVDVHHTGSRFRFCTNFIVTGAELDRRTYERRLEDLGDSVLVVGDPRTLKVHVHTDDPEAAKALFDGVGTIEREDIADMREQIAARDARLREARTGVLAIASGEGMGQLFGELGAIVVDGGPTFNPSTNDILKGIERVAASEVLVFPNSSDAVLAAEEAAKMSDRPAVVVPSRSQQGALAVLVELDADASAADNAERLSQVLATIRVGSVARAERDDSDGRFVRGDSVGFEDGEVVAWGGAGTTLARTLERLADGAELVTVIEGEGAPIPRAELEPLMPDGIELETHYGGQRLYWWLITAQ
jgi:DAK2 domain fusion protein YloV